MDTPSITQPKKEEEYLSWVSPSRLFKKRDKEFFTNIGAIVFLLTILLVFAREFLLIAAVLSIVFLIYVLSTVPPQEVSHRITNLGIESVGHFYRWEELVEFWFEEQWGQVTVVIKPVMGPRIIMLLGPEKVQTVRDIMTKFIPYREEPERTWVDGAANWLSKKVPLEKPTS